MKKINNLVAAFTMMAVLAFGTTFANAGILVSDSVRDQPCDQKSDDKGELGDIGAIITGIIIVAKTGIIIVAKGGILVSDSVKPCEGQVSKDGILVSD